MSMTEPGYGSAASTPKESTPADILGRIFDKNSALEEHLTAATQKVVGNVPMPGPDTPAQAGPPNVISMLYALEDRIQRCLEIARNLNNRL